MVSELYPPVYFYSFLFYFIFFSPSVAATAPKFSPWYQPLLQCMPSWGVFMTHDALERFKRREGRSWPACRHLEFKAPEGCHKCSSLPEGHSSVRIVSATIHQFVSPQPWLTCCWLISETDPACESALPEGPYHHTDTMRSSLSLDTFLSSTQQQKWLKKFKWFFSPSLWRSYYATSTFPDLLRWHKNCFW